MTSAYFFLITIWSFFSYSRKYNILCHQKFVFNIHSLFTESLQSGYTCDASVKLLCPQSQKIVILEVIYSSECPSTDQLINGSSMYAPSRCIGYYRERASAVCNGKYSCIVDNNIDQRPSFLVGKQANCGFQGQSINIEYSCIPGKKK